MTQSDESPASLVGKPDISEILAEAERLAATDLDLAIRHLEAAKDQAEFRPWGALNLLKFRDQSCRDLSNIAKTEQNSILDDAILLYRDFPEIHFTWTLLLRLARFDPRYLDICAELTADLMRAHEVPAWLLPTICECAMTVGGTRATSLMLKATEANLLNEEDAGHANLLIEFLSDIRSELANNVGHVDGWRIRMGGKLLSTNDDGEIVVSLSGLSSGATGPKSLILIEAFYFALYAALGWAPFRDDMSRLACETAASTDRDAAVFARFLPLLFGHDARLRQAKANSNRSPMARGELWVRAGNVELWALRCHMVDPVQCGEAAEQVAQGLATSSGADELTELILKDGWWPRSDPIPNIARLAMHAGWYARPGLADSAFQDWADRYQRALCRGQIFGDHARDLLPVIPLAEGMQGKTLHAFDETAITRRLSGAKVVFATPFSAKVQANFVVGGVSDLWRDSGLGAAMESLATVPAPMSIWPYRPHESWSESFSDLVDQSSKEVERLDADVFIASCGGYGLPIVDEIHRKYGITCVYIGHIINMYFGIFTKDLRESKRNRIYKETFDKYYWVNGGMSKDYQLLSRIEDGRYL